MAKGKQQVRKINESPKTVRGKRASEVVQKKEDDSKRNRQIAGLSFIFAGIILFILAVLPNTQGAVSRVLSSWVHLCFGLFSYILPFVFVAIGVSLFVSKNESFNSRNFIVGLSIFAFGFMPNEAQATWSAVKHILNSGKKNILTDRETSCLYH